MFFGQRIEIGSRLIKDWDRRVLQQCEK
jgi:hypothetical protein